MKVSLICLVSALGSHIPSENLWGLINHRDSGDSRVSQITDVLSNSDSPHMAII